MTPRRRRRMFLALAVALGGAVAVGLSVNAFRQNILFFFTPTQIAAGEAPVARPFRIGGLVKVGSFSRDPGEIAARFVVTDTANDVTVQYDGLLPDLFEEGKGVVARGQLDRSGVMQAAEVLAKHDENYMPPEAGAALEAARSLQIQNQTESDPPPPPPVRFTRLVRLARPVCFIPPPPPRPLPMIPEIGHFALILALCLAVVQAMLPVCGKALGVGDPAAATRKAAWGQFLFLVVAFGCLTRAFVVHDFSVAYAAQNSNSQLPLLYRVSGVWGAHEGSLLLWVLMLAGWGAAVAALSRNIPPETAARVVGVMGFIGIGFLLFTLLASNPFERLTPPPPEGRDLNPLLQDPGLAIHPPMLYMGYVGFAVAFSFAVVALWQGRLDAAWARWTRPWTNCAWAFLTCGIALGSWWAYYELGWGGWWFWDPVENASFMPWLSGTALIHSLAATEKRGLFKAWTALLAALTFSLCLLGAFLVRSGVLTSVHAFATDPGRGVFILALLAITVGGTMALFAWRAPLLRSAGAFGAVSRESGILLNNLFFTAATATVLIGTLYPLALDAAGLGKISVGAPYFNNVFAPLAAPLAALAGLGALARWKRDDAGRLSRILRWPFFASAGLGLAAPFVLAGEFRLGVAAGVGLACWTGLSTLRGAAGRLGFGKTGVIGGGGGSRSFWGMTLAHFGVAVFVAGVSLTHSLSAERDLRMTPGERAEIGAHGFEFRGAVRGAGPNYMAERGEFLVTKDGEALGILRPEKRFYPTSDQAMTEAAIDAGIFRDLYVSLGEPLGDGAWSVRLQVKPFVRWIWAGAALMALGALLAASDRRYRGRK